MSELAGYPPRGREDVVPVTAGGSQPEPITVPSGTTPPGEPARAGQAIANLLAAYGLPIAIAIIWITFAAVSGGTYLTGSNLALLTRQTAEIGVAAVGVSMVIIAGEFDLSLGSAQAVTASLFGVLLVEHNLNIGLAMLLVLACALGFGLLQGFLITRLASLGFQVASFIVTLASMLALSGVALLILPSPAAPVPNSLFDLGTLALNTTASLALVLVAVAIASYQMVRLWRHADEADPDARHRYVLILLFLLLAGYVAVSAGIPYLMLLTCAVLVLAEFIMRKTRLGRHLYAIGGNRKSAHLVGIRVSRSVLTAFVIMGVIYALLGLISTARLDGAVPTVGRDLPLEAIAAAAIGGVSLTGGKGRPYQALLGAVVIGSLTNGLALMAVPSLWQDIATGVVLACAVYFDVAVRQRARNAR